MSATAQNSTRATMNETLDYGSGPERPVGSPNMANASPQAPFRYTYGSGSRPLDGYTIKRAIGRGGFGEVYYATSDSGKEVALKLITRNVEIERRGVAQCMNLKCPNLLTIYDIRSNDAGETFVVMEYVSGPSLAGVLEKYPNGMPVNEIRAWLKGLVEGVDYLHDHGIVHRDLKPANLFLEEGVVKIGDYGLCKIISTQQGSEHSESIGTCHYMAPEISTGKYHKPIDIYAIGVLLFEMLTGRVPFEGETVGEVLMKHLTTRPDLSPLAEPYRTIVGEALAKDPVNRPKRAHDLLGSEDSPRPRDVRFIGEGKTSPSPEAAPNAAKGRGWWGRDKDKENAADTPRHRPEEDDILRIGEVDPVFYIGPETRPARPVSPTPRRPYVPTIRWVGDVIRKAPPRRPVPRPVAAPVRPARVVTPPPPAPPKPPPEPVPLPTTRVRVSELTGSMVKAAIAVAAICGVGLYATERRIPSEYVGFFFGTTLLGVWGLLLASKPFEGSKNGSLVRMLLTTTIGLGVGLAVGTLSEWLLVSRGTGAILVGLPDGPSVAVASQTIAYMLLFGLGFLVNGWFRIADRDRRSHIRAFPVLASLLLTVPLISAWPNHEVMWPVWLIPAVALVTQAVSPWNKQAAAYRLYASQNRAAKAA
jgi:serine/threonine protein kinase